jgi:hypothetical protein
VACNGADDDELWEWIRPVEEWKKKNKRKRKRQREKEK